MNAERDEPPERRRGSPAERTADRLRAFSIFLPLTLVVGVSLATLIGIAHYASSVVDALARAHMLERTEVAISVEEQRLRELLVEYSYWNSAWENLVQEYDPVWADENIGSYLYEEVGVDLTFVVDGAGETVAGFIDGQPASAAELAPMVDQVAREIAVARTEMQRPTPQVRYIAVDGVAYLLVLDTFVPEDFAPRDPDGSAIGFARRLDADRIDALGALYRIPELRLAEYPADLPNARKLTLMNAANEPVAVLTWADQTPANNIRRSLRPYVVVVIATMFVLIFWVFYLEIRSHREREALLREMASVDQLTGIHNRREFFVVAARELSRANRDGSPVSLMLLDVDHFKQVNDTLGHVVGDRILGVVGRQLRMALSESDVFARFGGDEFVAMLPDADAAASLPLAERLREDIADVCGRYTRERIECTVSIGIAQYHDGESVEQLISRADDALYQAKHAGRNRTVVAGARRAVFDDTTPSW